MTFAAAGAGAGAVGAESRYHRSRRGTHTDAGLAQEHEQAATFAGAAGAVPLPQDVAEKTATALAFSAED